MQKPEPSQARAPESPEASQEQKPKTNQQVDAGKVKEPSPERVVDKSKEQGLVDVQHGIIDDNKEPYESTIDSVCQFQL